MADTYSSEDYCYDKNGNYYICVDEMKLKKITKQEYMDATGESSFIIKKLKDSIYPAQGRNYVFLKFPDNFPKDDGNDIAGKYITADWMLANLITFLWKQDIITLGWDQGGYIEKKKIDHSGFISMNHKTMGGEDVVPLLVKLFGEDNVVIIDFIKNPKHKPKPGKEKRKWNMEISLKYPKKIRILVMHGYIAIGFNHLMIPWMYEHLKLKMVNKDKVHQGNRLVYYLDKYEIV